MPRPRKRLSSRDRELLMVLASQGLSQATIAHQLRVDAKTLREILRRDPLAADAYARGLAGEEEALVGSLRRKAEKFASPIPEIFLLKSRHGYIEGARVELEHSGGVTHGVLVVPAPVDPQEWAAAAAEHCRAIQAGRELSAAPVTIEAQPLRIGEAARDGD